MLRALKETASERWVELTRRLRHWLELPAEALATALEPLALAALTALYSMNAVRYSYPSGYAGLYSLMTQAIIARPWPPPSEIALYGPGGIPFVYPPLGLYLAAFFTYEFDISMLEYARWAPPVLTIVSLVLLYFFLLQLWNDRDKALLGAILAGVGAEVYVAHATAAGMVRAFALLWSFAALLTSLIVGRKSNAATRWSLATGLLLGLTVLTHLSYAAFLGLGLALIAVFRWSQPVAQRATRLGSIYLASLVVAAPWFILAISRHGPETLLFASKTHGTFALFQRASGNPLQLPVEALRWLAALGRDWTPRYLAGLTLLGGAYAVLKKQLLLPVWLIMLPLALGETMRFEQAIGGALAGNLIVDLAPIRKLSPVGRRTLNAPVVLLFYLLVVSPLLYQGARIVYRERPALDDQVSELTAWFRGQTPTDSAFLILPNEQSLGEWLPFLTGRTLAVAHWGAEWTGEYANQQVLQKVVGTCSEAQSLACLRAAIIRLNPRPQYLIVETQLEDLITQLSLDKSWLVVFSNERFLVFQIHRDLHDTG